MDAVILQLLGLPVEENKKQRADCGSENGEELSKLPVEENKKQHDCGKELSKSGSDSEKKYPPDGSDAGCLCKCVVE